MIEAESHHFMKPEPRMIVRRGKNFFIATRPEIPEAHGQGETKDAAVRDLEESIRSLHDYWREET